MDVGYSWCLLHAVFLEKYIAFSFFFSLIMLIYSFFVFWHNSGSLCELVYKIIAFSEYLLGNKDVVIIWWYISRWTYWTALNLKAHLGHLLSTADPTSIFWLFLFVPFDSAPLQLLRSIMVYRFWRFLMPPKRNNFRWAQPGVEEPPC